MEQILSSFVAIHVKKSYKSYVGFYRRSNDKPKTLYRVYIDLAIFNSIPNNYNELNSLFLFIKNKGNLLKNQIQDLYLLKYFENFILKSNDLNRYIEKINSQNYDYTSYTNIINKFILFINTYISRWYKTNIKENYY